MSTSVSPGSQGGPRPVQAPEPSLMNDATTAIRLAAKATAPGLIKAWLLVPAGLIAILAVCFGADTLFLRIGVSFPASVAVLILLFLGLLLSELVIGAKRTARAVKVIDVPAGWSLRWINILFTPTFIQLPLSPPIGVVEVFKIIAIFVVGWVAVTAGTAYLTRGIQLLAGTSKRADTERAEELGNEMDDIPTSHFHRPSTPDNLAESTTPSAATSVAQLLEPPPTARQDSSNPDPSPPTSPTQPSHTNPTQTPLPPTRARRWASLLILLLNLDYAPYLFLLLFIGIPIFYTTHYAMPLHLSLNVLTYFLAQSIPPTTPGRTFMHPVLITSGLSILSFWAFGATLGIPLTTSLASYRPGLKYLSLWRGARGLPGAGDILATALDAGIVALALPMYAHRRSLRAHAAAIAAPAVVLSVGSLLVYPVFCGKVAGLGGERSLAFGARSVTVALGIPATERLGGDVQMQPALSVAGGIVGVMVGGRILGWLGIREDDYVTRGVTFGANAGAIMTASLLRTDPRASALSSLSMTMFGTITVLFTSIPPIAAYVRSLAGV